MAYSLVTLSRPVLTVLIDGQKNLSIHLLLSSNNILNLIIEKDIILEVKVQLSSPDAIYYYLAHFKCSKEQTIGTDHRLQ